MVSLEPVNIQRLVRENQKRSDAESYARSITKGSVVSGWHEKNSRSSGCTRIGVSDCLQALQASTSPQATQRATASVISEGRDIIQEELLGKQALLETRKQRLQALMQQERLEYEAELRSRGLALVKQRI